MGPAFIVARLDGARGVHRPARRRIPAVPAEDKSRRLCRLCLSSCRAALRHLLAEGRTAALALGQVMPRLIEVRSYKLKPGAAAAFHAAAVSSAIPLLREWGTEVVAFGPSAHEPDTYFLIRAYANLADLRARQDAFYGSDAWKKGP